MLSEKLDKMEVTLDKMDIRIGRMEDQIKSIDQRLFRLEGAFEERGRWESRRTGTEREQEMGLLFLLIACYVGLWWLNRDEIREEVERDEEPY